MRATFEEIPAGTAGLRIKLARMRDLVERGKRSAAVRDVAARAVQHVAERNESGEVDALHRWVRRNIRYTRDPNGVEMFTDAELLLSTRSGDCDDLVILLASMLESVGYRTRFVAGGTGAEQWRHVWLQVETARGWRNLDPSAKMLPLSVNPSRIFAERHTEQKTMTNGKARRAPPGGAIVPIPQSTRAAELRRAGVRYRAGVRPPARESELDGVRYGGAIAFGMADLADMGCYHCNLAGMDGLFSKVFKKVKKELRRAGRKAKKVLATAGPLLNFVPVVGPILAPIAQAVATGGMDYGTLVQQVGGQDAERVFRSMYGHYSNWRQLYRQFRDSGQLPPGLTPQGASVATPGFVGGAGAAAPRQRTWEREGWSVLTPNYNDPSYRHGKVMRGRSYDPCDEWGLWTADDRILAQLRRGHPVRTPTGEVVTNESEWTAAKRRAHPTAASARAATAWCRPAASTAPSGPTLPAATPTPQQYPGPIGPAESAAAGGAPGWLIPAAIAGVGLLLLTRR